MDTVLLQLTDVFRIGLMIALVATMQKTAAVTGRVIPLALGVLFIAVMLPTMMPQPSMNVMTAVLAGIVSNTIILLVALAGFKIVSKLRR